MSEKSSNINRYDDDFLDDLMEDVMSTSEQTPAQQTREEEPPAPVLPTFEAPINEETPPAQQTKRRGLLSGFGSGIESNEVVAEGEKGADTTNESREVEVHTQKSTENKPARRGLLSGLLGGVSEAENGVESSHNSVVPKVEAETIVADVNKSKQESQNADNRRKGLLSSIVDSDIEAPKVEVSSEEKKEVSTEKETGVSTEEVKVSVPSNKEKGDSPPIDNPFLSVEDPFSTVEEVKSIEKKGEDEGYNPFKNRRNRVEAKTETPIIEPLSPVVKVESPLIKEEENISIEPEVVQPKVEVVSPVTSREAESEVVPMVEEEVKAPVDYNSEVGIWEMKKKKEEDNSDLFDEMLEDIIEEEEKSDSKENPIIKRDLEDVIVSSDGRSLAEVLHGGRSGPKSVRGLFNEIKNGEHEFDLDGDTVQDSKYLTHVKRVRKEQTEQEKRAKLSMKFIQRNSKFTEQEKIIMKNLGVTNKQLVKIMETKELTAKQKKDILGLGRYGPEKHFRGKRYKTTVGDSAMLEFLVKFKFANTRILRWLNDENQSRTWRKLNRLKESGLAESKSIIGIPDLWAATNAGVAISGYALSPGLRPMPKMQTISSNMGVNYLAACLWFNTINVLNLDDFPAHNRIIPLQDNGKDRVQGEMLVSELEIRSSLGKEINPMSTTMQTLGDARLYDVISDNVREAFDVWVEGGKYGESPEFQLGNEYMWVLYPKGQLTLSYHVPDLIVRRERGPNGEPRSIAVELERYEKSNDRYDKIMLAYKLDEHLYKEVVWVTPNARIARALAKAAKDVGFTRYRIVPIITKDGVYDKQDIWMI